MLLGDACSFRPLALTRKKKKKKKKKKNRLVLATKASERDAMRIAKYENNDGKVRTIFK
jgi:hypothetical protein